MTTGMVQDQNLEKHIEKQMGCMAGFFQIFDRHQVLSGKRRYSAKRLPPSVSVDSTSESEKSVESPATSRESDKHQNVRSMPSPDRSKHSHVATELPSLRSPVPGNHKTSTSETLPPKSPLPLSVFEFKEGTRTSWKFAREAPRLSLDSRATVDAKGSLYPREIRTNTAILSANRCENSTDNDDDGEKQRRSPSVIARLMGLETLQHSDPEPVKKAELRRSASESRVSKDLYQYRFADGNAFPVKQSQYSIHGGISSNVIRDNAANDDRTSNSRPVDSKIYAKAEPVKVYQHKGIGQRKSYFDSADFFPEPKQTSSVYGEIEKRLKMRGIDEPSKDLETLKQILEALQLKGLLHPRKTSNQVDYRNIVYDRSFSYEESPIVVMKPVRSPVATVRSARTVENETPLPPSSFRSRQSGLRRNLNLTADAVSPRRDRRDIDRSPRNQSPSRYSSPPARSESGVKSPSRRRSLSIEIQRKGSNVLEQRRVSPVHSPKLNSRKTASEQPQTPNRSPRNRKPTAEIHRKEAKVLPRVEDESSTMSESSISTSTDTEKGKVEEYKEGRSLLERCDKLLHSIAEITTTTTELQTSPVSVLDSSFYKDESSTSPIMKRTIDFKDQPSELEEEAIWGSALISSDSKSNDQSEDCDLVYISEILRASNCLPEDSDIFLLLEKQQYLKGNDTSKVSRLQRRVVFDTINEIVNRNRQLPPWKLASPANSTSLRQVWSEFRRIRERDESEDLFEVICGVLRKDLAGDAVHGWGDCPIEVSEAVLDIERLIFKDLIGETIRDLAAFSVKYHKPSPSCRKLLF